MSSSFTTSNYVQEISNTRGGLNMNNLSQAERNAVQQMDDNNLKDHLDQEDENDEQSGD
ncbi:hypothetical protein PDA01_06310 [Pediococcus damnosus]|nr:hypothetical protein PDA01_06310 [Pediococcus damnosus]